MFQEIYDYAINPHSATETTVVESLKKAITTSKYFTIDEEGEAATIKTNLTYPKNVGLPDGAVSLSYNEKTSKFEYDQASNLTGIRNINPESITYPALLSYYVNTPIRTNDNTVATTDWPANTTDWATDTKWVNGWSKNATVTRTTHAIALMNNINYGVASLKLQVKCNADQNKLKDKDDEDIDIPSGGFKVTGLLIGNQPKGVDYEFSPILSSRADNFSQTIWDSNVNLSATTSTPSDANYTIVLPNLIDGTEQNEVSFAVELENNADRAFKGHDGIIEKNAKFYLVGKLTPKTNDTDSDAKAVFQSDYQTTVTANISTLKNAYNCIPDIRTTEMQLGLSVDLQWEKGFSYDITIGGDNN